MDGGAEGNRTPDLVIANDALSQLSYSPIRKAGSKCLAGQKSRRACRKLPTQGKDLTERAGFSRKNLRRSGNSRESALLWYNIHAYLLHPLITLLIWVMIISAVLSWLVAFNVVNPRNEFVGMIYRFSDAVTRPLLGPLQRIIPPLGGVDITPIILILLLQFFDAYVLGQLIIPALASITPI